MKTLNDMVISMAIYMVASQSAQAVQMKDMMQDPPAAQERVFKKVGGTELKLFYFAPPGLRPGERCPAIVWIHGGGWTGGTLDGFMPHCRYFATRGMATFTISYRLVKPDGPAVADCIADCKSAIRYIRSHATEFGVDPDRIAAAGDSAGGHLAACLGTIDGFNDPADDKSVSAVPNAMLLYNPIVDMTEGGWIKYAIAGPALAKNPDPNALKPSPEKLALAKKLSPLFNVRPNVPPTLLMHGLADKVVTPEQARQFADAMKKAGNRCELVLLKGTGHAFVVAKWKAPEPVVVDAIRAGDDFLVSIGYLRGTATLEVSREPAWEPYRTKE